MDDVTHLIKDCLQGRHPGCSRYREAKLPTRVLDVGDPRSSTVSLRSTGVDEHGDYTALSYCWGGPQPITATKGNMSQLTKGVEVTSLPQTLQDAVLTTRRLGVRHLWVDALCIVQDDPQDKKREIEQMGAIYRNSVVTIAATNSRSASEGFLKCSMAHTPAASCTMQVYLPESSVIGKVTLSLEAKRDRTKPELLRTRGWAFQEAILSPRILSFSTYEVFYSCQRNNKSFNSGSLAHLSTLPLTSLDVKFFDDFEKNRRKDADGWMKTKYLAGMWQVMLGDYTLRALTDPEDKLPAVQGLANELMASEHLDEDVDRTYVAGTWIAGLPQLLLWHRSNVPTLTTSVGDDDHASSSARQPTRQIVRSVRAPSWSWACLDSPIVFTSLNDDFEQFDASFSVLQGLSATSPATGMVYDAPVLEVTCEICRRSIVDFSNDKSENGDVRVNSDLDVDELDPSSSWVYYLLFVRYICPEGTAESPTEGPLQLFYISGIVSQQMAGGVFKRLGYFRWDVCRPADEKYLFGPRETVKLA